MRCAEGAGDARGEPGPTGATSAAVRWQAGEPEADVDAGDSPTRQTFARAHQEMTD